MSWILIAGWIELAGVAAGAAAVIVTSLRERRYRAAHVAASASLPVLALLATVLLVDFPGRPAVVLAALIFGGVAALVLTLPIGMPPRMRLAGMPVL